MCVWPSFFSVISLAIFLHASSSSSLHPFSFHSFLSPQLCYVFTIPHSYLYLFLPFLPHHPLTFSVYLPSFSPCTYSLLIVLSFNFLQSLCHSFLTLCSSLLIPSGLSIFCIFQLFLCSPLNFSIHFIFHPSLARPPVCM